MTADERLLLRQTVATLAYRSRRVLADAPVSFSQFRPAESSRAAGEVLAHMGDLFDWALSIADGQQAWRNAEPLPWNDEVARFYATLKRFDDRLADSNELKASCAGLFQGPVADALTHLGQLSMMRGMAGAPTKGENYFQAEIVAGRIDPEAQSAPRREF
ncbi:MAG: hypothetical protein ABI672_03525 [Vicinamibacteria bacterium]